MKRYRNLDKMKSMYDKYISENPALEVDVPSLDVIEFPSLIYMLETGKFEITGLQVSAFIRQVMVDCAWGSNGTLALDILNAITDEGIYSKEDFLRA